MYGMEELTSAEIAARVGKDQRTIQRWLKSGKLPAIPLADNRYGVNTGDLEHLARPEHVTESGKVALEVMQIQYPLEEQFEHLQLRVEDLASQLYGAERKIEHLQYRLDQILKETRENATSKKKVPARRASKKRRLRRG